MLISIDTETTGTDMNHGARPFFATICKQDGSQLYWEWEVDVLTRMPIVPLEDVEAIRKELAEAEWVVGQNIRFDAKALSFIGITDWPWHKTHDTLIAAHLLGSNQQKDLTALAIQYLGVNIEKYELELEECVKESRRLVRSQFPDWMIAKEGLPCMPSAGEKTWKYDTWLPRAIANELGYAKGECKVVNSKYKKHDLSIMRPSKWGNPFVIGKHGSREEVIEKYRKWLPFQKELMEALPELEGKVLGCCCKPLPCHGDVLQDLLREKVRHKYWDVLSKYANTDSEVTLSLWGAMQEELHRRGLWEIYLERMKVVPVAFKMEHRGVTISKVRLEQLRKDYIEESEKAHRICTNLASEMGYDLVLPKGSNNDSLSSFVFGPPLEITVGNMVTKDKSSRVNLPNCLNLPIISRSEKTGAPSFDKATLEQYEGTLDPKSKGFLFIKTLRGKRSRDTAVAYLEGYERFWLQWKECPNCGGTGELDSGGITPWMEAITLGCDVCSGWYVLYPSLNMTGTSTLRWSSSHPNEQNISKKENFNLRYAFGPAPGREWWSLDAKNIELRIPFYKSKQQTLIDLFEHPDDPPYYGSNHLANFHAVYEDLWNSELGKVCNDKKCGCQGRVVDVTLVGPHCKKKYASTWYQWCKNGGFCKQYGGQRDLTDATFRRKGAYDLIESKFDKLSELNRQCVAFANKHGYIETLPDKLVNQNHGYPLLCTRTDFGEILPTVPLSYMVQGTAMWWTMVCMTEVQKQLDKWNEEDGFDGYMNLQVHDEICFDFPKSSTHPKVDKENEKKPGAKFRTSNLWRIRKIQAIMESVGSRIDIPTPVNVEYHEESWSEGLSM